MLYGIHRCMKINITKNCLLDRNGWMSALPFLRNTRPHMPWPHTTYIFFRLMCFLSVCLMSVCLVVSSNCAAYSISFRSQFHSVLVSIATFVFFHFRQCATKPSYMPFNLLRLWYHVRLIAIIFLWLIKSIHVTNNLFTWWCNNLLCQTKQSWSNRKWNDEFHFQQNFVFWHTRHSSCDLYIIISFFCNLTDARDTFLKRLHIISDERWR